MVKPQLKIVKELSREDVIHHLNNGYKSLADLERRSGIDRKILEGLQEEIDPKRQKRLRMPSRKKLNLIEPEVEDAPGPTPDPPKPYRPPIFRYLIGGVCLVLGVGFGVGNALMNYRFGVSLAQDENSQMVLGGVALLIDGGALVLPATAGYLREMGFKSQARQARMAWLLCVGLSIGAALGFASSNIGDALQARGSVFEQRAALMDQKKRAEVDRKVILEIGNPSVLENQMNAALGAVPRKNREASKDCKEPTLSAAYCADFVRLRDAFTAAKARVELDEKIGVLTSQIAALPSISEKDPGAEQIAQMSFGLATPEQARSYLMRCFAVLSVLASGLLPAFARTLFRRS